MLSYPVGGAEWQGGSGDITISTLLISYYILSLDSRPGDYHGRLIKHLLHLEPPVTGGQEGESPGAWLDINS